MGKRIFWNFQSHLHEDGYSQNISPRKSKNTDGISSNENFSYFQKVQIYAPPEVIYPYQAANCNQYRIPHCLPASGYQFSSSLSDQHGIS
jgi:hypothetical protein